MSYTYDLTNDIGKARLYGQDHPDGGEDAALFSDEEITVFLDDNDQTVKLAAADMLERVANDQTLLLKKLTLGGGALVTDGPAVAEDLRKGAALLRQQVAAGIVDDEDFWSGQIDFAEWNVGNRDEIWYKSGYRS